MGVRYLAGCVYFYSLLLLPLVLLISVGLVATTIIIITIAFSMYPDRKSVV